MNQRKFAIQFRQPSEREIEIAQEFCQLAAMGNVEELKIKMKEAEKEKFDINSIDYDLRSALHLAAACGKFECVQFLIQNGAKMMVDKFGGLPIHDALNYLQSQPLYVQTVKNIQLQEIEYQIFEYVLKEGFFSFNLIAEELEYFLSLGIDDYYFSYFKYDQIAKHIHAYISAKKVAEISRQKENFLIDIPSLQGDEIFYLYTSRNQNKVESLVEEYIQKIPIDKCVSVTYMKSQAPAIPKGTDSLAIYVIKQESYQNVDQNESNQINDISSSEFFKPRTAEVLSRYQEVINLVVDNPVPVMKIFQHSQTTDFVVTFARSQGCQINSKKYQKLQNKNQIFHNSDNRQLAIIFENLGINVHKKYMETFSNGIVVYSFYLKTKPSDKQIEDLQNITNLLFTMPYCELTEEFFNKTITGRQLLYFYSASIFCYYFMHEELEEFEGLYKFFEKDKQNQNKLTTLKQQLVTEVIKISRLFQIVKDNLSQAKEIFNNFARKCQGELKDYKYKEIDTIIKGVKEQEDKKVLETFQLFNNSILKTNFYHTNKSALSFRLNPENFLQKIKWKEIPFGIFMVIGQDFQGFHLRFRDIARGGIRLIKYTPSRFNQNRTTQFNENYRLAETQKLKNKDILESGAKGTILMLKERNHMDQIAFLQYIDAILDLILEKKSTQIFDIYLKQEIIFFRPDENTADYMDLACLHAKKRGYQYWKSISTGKSVMLGGIPHDVFGMTTRSVRQYSQGIMRYEKLNNEENLTKFMTGGPDGDLGSNEIKMSKEKIIVISDLSGVLYDPEGIDRNTLIKLANNKLPNGKLERRSINSFFEFGGKLSKNGYFVPAIKNVNQKLPNGKVIVDGIAFRDNIHLDQSIFCDFFVPCGGRPNAVDGQNIKYFFCKDDENKCRFKYIVEGANLFFSEQARQFLESKGVIIFKDASTNKGGVTSSSLEVMAALCLDDQEFEENMTVSEDNQFDETKYNPFYQQYVKDIISTIERNARQEFEYIWSRLKQSKMRSSEITDELSNGMNKLTDDLLNSDMFNKIELREKILQRAIPQCLIEKVGFQKILQRLPESYQRSMFSKYLAQQYYYTYGTEGKPFQFYEFMKKNFNS